MIKNTGGPAFPSEAGSKAGVMSLGSEGMTLRQYAAIKLRVPDSGTDWLDEMILKSHRDELAAKAMQAYFTDPSVGFGRETIENGTASAYRIANAMLGAKK